MQTYFLQLLRLPLVRLPRSLSDIQDASSALQRLSHIFHAELREDGIPIIDTSQEYAISVSDATFEWESSEEVDKQIPRNPHAEDSISMHKDGPVFRVSNITLTVPRGQLAAIVGPIGSGKVCLTLRILSCKR